MGQGKNSKFNERSNKNFADKNSAFLAPRGDLEKGSVSFPKKASAFLSPRSEPQKGKATFNTRYK